MLLDEQISIGRALQFDVGGVFVILREQSATSGGSREALVFWLGIILEHIAHVMQNLNPISLVVELSNTVLIVPMSTGKFSPNA